jgi:phosphatidylglycerophosphatase A
VIRAFTTVGYIGLIPRAPGTFGSLAGVVLAYLLLWLGIAGYLIVGLLLFVVGTHAVRLHTAGLADHDPSEIVIDEVVGQMIALLPVICSIALMDFAPMALWPGWVSAFILFRVFDIWKPWPVSWADQQATPLGVMLDDVIAGGMAAIGVIALAALAHLVFLV